MQFVLRTQKPLHLPTYLENSYFFIIYVSNPKRSLKIKTQLCLGQSSTSTPSIKERRMTPFSFLALQMALFKILSLHSFKREFSALSSMMWGVSLRSSPAASQHLPLSRRGVTHPEPPHPHHHHPAKARTKPRDPAAKTPAGISQRLSLPPAARLSNIFFQQQHFSKADPTPGEYIIIASPVHLLEQHLGRGFRSFWGSQKEGKLLPGNNAGGSLRPSRAANH